MQRIRSSAAVNVPGFKILETLQASSKAVVYRGEQLADRRPVIVKQLADEYPTPEQLAAFRQEFEINHRLTPESEVCRLERIDERSSLRWTAA